MGVSGLDRTYNGDYGTKSKILGAVGTGLHL